MPNCLIIRFFFFGALFLFSQSIAEIQKLPFQKKLEVCDRFVDDFLTKTSIEDKIFLEYFFREIFLQDSFAYVLAHAKPMAIDSYRFINVLPGIKSKRGLVPGVRHFFSCFRREEITLCKAIETWRKYEALFDLKNFKFQYLDSVDLTSRISWRTVVLINKNLLGQLVEKESRKFHQLYPQWQRANDFVEHFVEDKVLINKVLVNDELLGYCLGYGKKNARLFAKMAEIMKKKGENRFSIHNYNSEKSQNLRKEREAIERRLGYSNGKTYPKFHHIAFIGFRCDFADEETLTLIRKYKIAQKHLHEHFQGKSFLREALLLLLKADSQRSAL